MSPRIHALAAAFALAVLPLAADEAGTRLRVENANRDGRVEIVRADESVRTVEIRIPGVPSGESVTVEAPAPRVRLGGGSITGDPLLEAMVDQNIRNSSRRPPTISVLPAPPRYRAESSSPYVTRVFTDVGFAYWLAAPTPFRHTAVGQPCCGSRERPVALRPSSASRSAGGRYSTRGMMPRR